MANKQVIDDGNVLKAFKRAVKGQIEEKKITVTYLDKDGNIKKFKVKIKRRW